MNRRLLFLWALFNRCVSQPGHLSLLGIPSTAAVSYPSEHSKTHFPRGFLCPARIVCILMLLTPMCVVEAYLLIGFAGNGQRGQAIDRSQGWNAPPAQSKTRDLRWGCDYVWRRRDASPPPNKQGFHKLNRRAVSRAGDWIGIRLQHILLKMKK